MGSVEGTSPHRARGILVASHERTMESTGRSLMALDKKAYLRFRSSSKRETDILATTMSLELRANISSIHASQPQQTRVLNVVIIN